MYRPRGHCGVVFCHSLHDTYKAVKAIQHRGQDTAGIAAKSRYGIDIVRWGGLVSDFSLDNVGKKLRHGDMFIAHVRYATYGSKDMLYDGAHPRYLGGKRTAEYKDSPHSHMIVRGATKAIVHNGTLVGVSSGEGIDTDMILGLYDDRGIEAVIETLPSSYAAALLDMQTDEAIVFRDRHEIRPLWIGEKDSRIVAASEDVAIWEIGGRPIREVKGGELVYINHDNADFRSVQVVDPDPKQCFFEWNYISGQSSTLDGRAVSQVRYKIGEELGREFRPDGVDIVTYIPHSPKQMARGYSEARGLPFTEVFYKVKMHRAFLGPTIEARAESIGGNLFVLDNVDLKGKGVVVIDDSVVRLNNARCAAKLIKERGVKWMALVLGTPPIGPVVAEEQRGCLFGVDMPPGDEFAIRRYETVEGIKEASSFDNVYFLSTEGLERAHGVPLARRCTYCIGGPNPVSKEELEALRSLEL